MSRGADRLASEVSEGLLSREETDSVRLDLYLRVRELEVWSSSVSLRALFLRVWLLSLLPMVCTSSAISLSYSDDTASRMLIEPSSLQVFSMKDFRA